MRIGVISDTHGLLRPEALTALAGSDLILHAGDIGGPHILEALAALAPVQAVRGNNDQAPWSEHLPESLMLSLHGVKLHVLHDVKTLALDPAQRGIAVVVSGHSHKPVVTSRDGVLYLNPGSAGPRRFRLPVSLARLRIEGGAAVAELVELL